MSNDGWGKMPTMEPWGNPTTTDWPAPAIVVTHKDGEPSTPNWPAPAVSDGWGQTAHDEWVSADLAKIESNPAALEWPQATLPRWGKNGSVSSWPAEKAEIDKFAGDDQWSSADMAKIDALRLDAEYEEREKQWTHNALDSANTRASVINSLNGRKDEYTIDQDGELSNIKETVPAKKPGEPTGWYLAYSNGKWLHAILSGPYSTTQEALLRSETVWNKFTNDGAFQLAFDNKFNRDGIYCAEIPLSLKRHGAYGVLT